MSRRTTPSDPTVVGQQVSATNVRNELAFLSAQVALRLQEFDDLIRDTDWRIKESE